MNHHDHVYAAAMAVRELGLSSDPCASPELRDAAARIDRAILGLGAAGDLPSEREEVGSARPIDVLPDQDFPEARALDEGPPTIWAAHRELEASLSHFLATVNNVAPMPNESAAYHAAIHAIGDALADIRWQHLAAVDFAQAGMPLHIVSTDIDSTHSQDHPDPAPGSGLSPGPAPARSDAVDAWRPETTLWPTDHQIDDGACRFDLALEDEESWHREAALDSGLSGPEI